MRYYKNLWKGKHYKILLGIAIIGGIGLVSLFFFIRGIIDPSLAQEISVNVGGGGYYHGDPSLYCAVVFLYIGFFFVPVVSKYSQDMSEYQIWVEEDYICIKFRKHEWKIKKNEFSPTKLFYRDKNRKFVPMYRGYQVYNAVYGCEELKIQGASKLLNLLEGEGIREVSPMKKKAFVKVLFRAGPLFYLLVECFGSLFLIMGISYFFMMFGQRTIIGVVGYLFFTVLFTALGSLFVFPSHATIRERRHILKNPVYKRDVIFQEKYREDNCYYITVGMNEEIYFDKKFRIHTINDYNSAEEIQWEAYFYKYKGKLKVAVHNKNEKKLFFYSTYECDICQ